MQRRLAELQAEAEAHELATAGMTKEQVMQQLAKYYRFLDNRPRVLLPQVPVMMLHSFRDLTKEKRESILKDGAWAAEQKYDGCRIKLHFGEKENRLDSRHRSVKTYEYVERTDNFPHLRDMGTDEFTGTVLDGELIMPTEKLFTGEDAGSLGSTAAVCNSHPERAIEIQAKYGNCRLIVFDILFYKGDDIRARPFVTRRACLNRLVNTLYLCHGRTELRLSPLLNGSKADAFQHIVYSCGGEGIVLKYLNGTYRSGKRTWDQLKWKKHETCDCFITGYEEGEGAFSGFVGSLVVSVFDKAGHKIEVAAVQPGTVDFRRTISEPGSGQLKDVYYGKVIEVEYQQRTVHGRLRHPVLVRFREDKSMHDCEVDWHEK